MIGTRRTLAPSWGYEDYKYLPVRFGAVVDSMASEATSKKLENNEKNMKSIILGGE